MNAMVLDTIKLKHKISLLSTPPFFNPSIDRMDTKSKDSATARVSDLPLSGIILFHTSVVFSNILTCFLIVEKEHIFREKPLSLTESKRELQTDEGYTLTKLSQDEILVEFSDQSIANPPNWTAVRTNLCIILRLLKLTRCIEKKTVQRHRGTLRGSQ
jgi:hypothetical protein